MPIKRGVRIDPEKLGISRDPEGDRRRLLEQSQWTAQSKIDALRSNHASHGASAAQIRDRMKQRGLFLSMNDLLGIPDRGPRLDRQDAFQGMDVGHQVLTEEFPTSHDRMITEDDYDAYGAYEEADPYSEPAKPQRRPPQRQALREQIVGSPPRRAPAGGPAPARTPLPWGVRAFMGETKGGNQIPIWKVVNGRTGSSVNKLFRVENVANCVATMLNESGDINDPRALNLIRIHDKREALLKEARLLEKTADGKPMKTERLKTLYREIGQLDSRLGV